MKRYETMTHIQEWREDKVKNLQAAAKFIEQQTRIIEQGMLNGDIHRDNISVYMDRTESIAGEIASGGMPATVKELQRQADLEQPEKKPIYELMEEWANAKPDDEGVIDLISEAVWEHPLNEIVDFFDPKGKINDRLDEEMYWYVEWRREELQKAEDE